MADTTTALIAPRPTVHDPARRPLPGRLLVRLAREPLVHFLLLGAIVFGINATIEQRRARERMIVVTPAIRQTIADGYRDSNGAAASPEELERAVRGWILNEKLVREALALGLDRGDDMIRDRIAHKMRLLIFSNVVLPPHPEPVLRAWFEAHRAQYDEPDRVTFLAITPQGADARQQAEAAVAQIEAGTEPEELRRKARVFADRNRTGLVAGFGEAFTDALRTLPHGAWRVLQSTQGWHVVRVEAVTVGKPTSFEAVKDRVLSDWTSEQSREQANRAVDELGAAYAVRREDL